jgi:hypothetical protein
MKTMALSLLLAFASLSAMASDAADKEALRYNDAVTKLQKAYDEGVAKEKTRAIIALAALAKQSVKAGDLEAAGQAWKAVLALDDQQADARKYFEVTGKLDAVLEEINRGGTKDLLGDTAKPAGDTAKPASAPAKGDDAAAAPAGPVLNGEAIDIPAVASATAVLGPFKAGTTLAFQYAAGTWTWAKGADAARYNPDLAATPDTYRLRLTSSLEKIKDNTLAVVPAGTSRSFFVMKLEKACDKLFLNINAEADATLGSGQVKYLVKVTPP